MHIIGLGVSFPSFLDIMEYNSLIGRLEIGEFGPIGKSRKLGKETLRPVIYMVLNY